MNSSTGEVRSMDFLRDMEQKKDPQASPELVTERIKREWTELPNRHRTHMASSKGKRYGYTRIST